MDDGNKTVRNKRIARNTIFLYIRLFILLIIGLYTSRVTLDLLGVQDFGIYNLVGGIIIVMGFISNSMALSVDRFIAFNLGLNNKEKTKEVFSMAINIHIIIALIIIILGETLGLWFINTQLIIPENKMTAANIIYQSSIFSFALNILGAPYNSDIIAHEKMGIYALVGTLQGISKLAAALVLPFIRTDKLSMYAIFMTFPAIIYFTINYIYTKYNFEEASYSWKWSKHLFIEMSKFAGFSTFGNMATAIVNQGQSILLNIFYGPSLNAVRGLSLQINAAVSNFTSGIYTAVNPQIIKSYAKKDKADFEQLIFNSTILAYFMLFTITLPIILEINPILSIWLKNVPKHTVIFVRLILINSLIYNFVTPTWMALQATGKVARIHLITGSINLLNIVVTYVLWKSIICEPYTIIIINIIVSFAMQVASIIIQKQQLNIKAYTYTKKVVTPSILSSSIACIIPVSLSIKMGENIISFLLIFIVSVFCSSIAFYKVCFCKELKIYIKTIILKKVGNYLKKSDTQNMQ